MTPEVALTSGSEGHDRERPLHVVGVELDERVFVDERPPYLAATGVIFSASDSSGEGRATGFVTQPGFSPQYLS
jgi:hypothetical protein